jgi:hypothetical protein
VGLDILARRLSSASGKWNPGSPYGYVCAFLYLDVRDQNVERKDWQGYVLQGASVFRNGIEGLYFVSLVLSGFGGAGAHLLFNFYLIEKEE